MIKFYFSDLAKVVLAFILAILQLDVKAAAAHTSMVTIGDEIDGMILTTGAADARPLWAFCASVVSKNVTTANCRVPQMPKLSIGHAFLGTEEALRKKEWSDLRWELYIDDQFIDLNDFGTYDYLQPTMAPNPSLVREVFMKVTAWDVVLTNLQPGVHTLEGRVWAGAEEHQWVVNLVIEGSSSQGNRGHKDKTDGDNQAGCPAMGLWLSRFHPSCRLYG